MEPWFYSNIGLIRGPTPYDMVPDAVGVFSDPGGIGLIGMAHCIGKAANGAAMWRLVIRGVDAPYYWTIIDREFVPAQ